MPQQEWNLWGNWNKWSEQQKDRFVEELCDDSFANAMKEANWGKVTPVTYFSQKLQNYYGDGYSQWLTDNDWAKSVIKRYEDAYGFKFNETFAGGVGTNTGIVDPNAPPETQPELSWFAKNKFIIAFAVIALVTVGIFIYKRMKK